MEWKVGFKLIHPFNPDWGIGIVTGVGPQGRNIQVHFPATDERVTFSTHAAAFQRWVFPMGSSAHVLRGEHEGREVVLVDRTRDEAGRDTYKTEDNLVFPEEDLEPLAG